MSDEERHTGRVGRTHRRIFECAAYYREHRAGSRGAPKAPTLAALAEYIQATNPILGASARDSFVSTDRKYKGKRWRVPGEGRKGTLLTVYDRASGERVFSHNSGEPARTNSEAVEWLVRHRFSEGAPARVHKQFGLDDDMGREAIVDGVERFDAVTVRFADGEPSLETGRSSRLVSGHDLVTPLDAAGCRTIARRGPECVANRGGNG